MGLFELAHDGTLFLDEIADLPRTMQAKLLRVLQEKEIRRVGGSKTIKINTRIISATNKDLEEMVREEKFREDLYYRLNVIEINIPPLRERKEDIGILTHSILEEICNNNNKKILKLDNEVIRAFQSYKWKGNIRELRNTIENIVVLSEKQSITTDDIPSYILESSNLDQDDTDYPLDLSRARRDIEIKHILKALKVSDGNKSTAGKLLNIPRSTLYYKMDLYNIEDK
jgi:transcriptional regulator with PAS, ATPase and Fis domain